MSLTDQRKIVLLAGSSVRFGFDSALLDLSFPEYEIVNMGVFAYTNAKPQLDLILTCMGEGDIAFPKETYLDPMNAVYHKFLEKGIRVYYTYSPRNAQAISASSTMEARAALDAYLRENLIVPIITELEDSLWPGTYLYGTDNHLSTEGVAIHTVRIIAALRAQLAAEGMD